jgi:hypothetical protein
MRDARRVFANDEVEGLLVDDFMSELNTTCYFCGKIIENPSYISGLSRCMNHHNSPIVSNWYSAVGSGNLEEVSFSGKYAGKTYCVVHNLLRNTTFVDYDFRLVFDSDSLMDLTPENIERKLQTILTFM